MEVQKQDFEDALKEMQPSALREVLIEIPEVNWEDVGAQDDVKTELKQVVEWPIKYRERFAKIGIKPPVGVLLYGPPGNGKTLLAKAIATESGANFISVRGPELVNKWVGETEKGIRQIFKKARQVSPCIIFFDEFDAIASERGSHDSSGTSEKMVNQLLTEIDGIQSLKDVIVLAATNRPDLIDPALKRPGRFDKEILVRSPDEIGRNEILKIHTKGIPLHSSVSIADLAKKTKGYSGADLANLVREAGLIVLQEKMYYEEALDILLRIGDNPASDVRNMKLDKLKLELEKIVSKIDDIELFNDISEFLKGDLSKVQSAKAFDKITILLKDKVTKERYIITKSHFEMILKKTTASINEDTQEAYAEYRQTKSTGQGFKPNYVG